MRIPDWFRDPVTVKEMSGSSRRWQTYASRMLYVGVIAGVLWNFSDELKARAFARSASEYAWLGRRVFMSFFALQLLIVSLSAVSAAADLVVREARSGTLGLLASTPLSAWRIALGKWKAATAQAGFLVLCGGPVFGICVSIGAGGISQFLCVCALSLATAALSAALALFFSTVFRTGVAAILVTIAALGVYTAAPIFLLRLHSSDEAFLLGAFFGHPLFGGLITLSPGNLLASDPWLADYGWIATAAVSAFATFLLLRWTASRIRTLSRRTPEPALLTRAFEAMDRFYETAGPARLRGIRLFADAGGVWDHRVVLWKELKVRLSGKLRNSVRISLAMLVVLTIVFFVDIDWLGPIGMMGGIGFLFMAFSNGAGLFVTEKEERKWDILLATPLSSWDIVASKLLAGLVPLAPVAVILVLFAVASAWLFHVSPADLALALTVLILPVLLSYAAAAACSLRADTLRGAFTTAFGLMTAFLVVLPVLLHNSGSLLTGRHRLFAAAVFSPTPYLDLLEAPFRWGHSYYYYQDSVLPSAFPCFVVLYGGAIAGLVAYMKTRFDSISGRS